MLTSLCFKWLMLNGKNPQSTHIFLPQAIERAAIQVNPAQDDQAGPSGGAEQGLSEQDNMEVRGGRFSKSAEERQKMLKQRKEEMLQQARRLVDCCLHLIEWKGFCLMLIFFLNDVFDPCC